MDAFPQSGDPMHTRATGRSGEVAPAGTLLRRLGGYFFFTTSEPENASASITPSPFP